MADDWLIKIDDSVVEDTERRQTVKQVKRYSKLNCLRPEVFQKRMPEE